MNRPHDVIDRGWPSIGRLRLLFTLEPIVAIASAANPRQCGELASPGIETGSLRIRLRSRTPAMSRLSFFKPVKRTRRQSLGLIWDQRRSILNAALNL